MLKHCECWREPRLDSAATLRRMLYSLDWGLLPYSLRISISLDLA